MPDRTRIIIFARAPVPGQAKTRLIPALGPVGAAGLSARLTTHVVGQAMNSQVGPVELWCGGDTEHPLFLRLGREHGISRYAQYGENLGDRMHRALIHATEGGDRAVIVGADCPGLVAQSFRDAARFLCCGRDAVLGPAYDGGYALLGVRSPAPSLFDGIPWSSDVVAELTRNAMRKLGWCWAEIGPFHDIDRTEDLIHVSKELLPGTDKRGSDLG